MDEQNFLYVCLFLDKPSQSRLFEIATNSIQAMWGSAKCKTHIYCDHMTIMFHTYNGDDREEILNWCRDHEGQKFSANITHIGFSETNIAVKIETEVPSTNAIKHITLATNISAGGTPVKSNDIVTWMEYNGMQLTGTIQFKYKNNVII